MFAEHVFLNLRTDKVVLYFWMKVVDSTFFLVIVHPNNFYRFASNQSASLVGKGVPRSSRRNLKTLLPLLLVREEFCSGRDTQICSIHCYRPSTVGIHDQQELVMAAILT